MALSEDQKAMLRLLAQREEGYEDIAALLGLSVGEVRARVKEALGELDSAGEPVVEPGPEEEPPSSPAETPAAAGPVAGDSTSSSQAAGEVLPPTPPAEEGGGPTRSREEEAVPSPAEGAARGGGKAGPAVQPARKRRRLTMPRTRRRMAELAGGVLAVLLLVLFATGAVDLGGDSDSDGGDGEGRQPTGAVLAPPGGGEASGRAVFGRIGKGPVLQVQAEGVDPSGGGRNYAVWLYRSPELALRIGAVKVDEGEDGIAAQFPVPVELLSYVAGGAFDEIKVSLTRTAAYKSEVAQARKQKRLPAYTGKTVLEGEITGPLAEGVEQ